MEVKEKKPRFIDLLLSPFRTTPKEKFIEFFNPLNAKVYSVIKINKLDWESLEFEIVSIAEYTRHLNGNNYVFTDYDCVAKSLGSEPVRAILRVIPVSDRYSNDADGLTVLLLEPEDEQGYSDGLQAVINEAEQNKVWTVTLDEEDGLPAGTTQEIVYDRANGVPSAYLANVCTVSDKDRNGKFDHDEIDRSDVKYLDFCRVMKLEGDVESTEYFIVEQDQSSMYVRMYRGVEINQNRITVV